MNAKNNRFYRQKPKKEYHTSLIKAAADGWRYIYEGGLCTSGDYRGRLYGQKVGNHRIFRCYKGLKAEQKTT